MSSTVLKEKIWFEVEGARLSGDLYTPDGFERTRRYPAVVVQGSAGSVKEQLSGGYARRLAGEGFVALAFDYRNYGESEGEPRQFENASSKVEDLKGAVTYLLSLPFVSSVGALGVCASGGSVLALAESDPRLGAAATVAGMLGNIGAVFDSAAGEGTAAALKQRGIDARKEYERSGQAELMTAYSDTDPGAFYFGEVDYYLNKDRGDVSTFRNQLAVMSYEPIMQFDPSIDASSVGIPFIIFHSDLCIFPAAAKEVFDKLTGPKELVWGVDTHFDYYDKPDLTQSVVAKVRKFFHQYID